MNLSTHPVALRALAHFDRLFPDGARPGSDSRHELGSNRSATITTHEAWLSLLDSRLEKKPQDPSAPLVLDLFSGCGGLALGFEAAGFRTTGFEMDADAAATYRKNLDGDCRKAFLEVGFEYGLQPDVIIGGPPCQPFSVIGYQRGSRDARDGFPAFLDAVQQLRPKVAMIENVRGMLYRNRSYLDDTVRELRRFGYLTDVQLLKAVDYGVPQNRERVIIVAYERTWTWPAKSMTCPVSAGIALGNLARSIPEGARFLTASQDRYIAEYERKSKCINPRDLHLDRPARTVTCRNLGASTSDMQRIRLADGRRRMLTMEEGARLQSFPDWYRFVGQEHAIAKQIGNAVPPLMARALADSVLAAIDGSPGQPPTSLLELAIP